MLGRPAERAWWVPGRVEVFGKHTDYGGGPSLVGALPRGFLIAGSRRRDDRLRVVDTGDGSAYELHLATGRSADATGWRRYADVLARRLARNFPGARLGADLTLASDLPSASGMSSSSALVVGLAHAIVRLCELDELDDWRAAIASPIDQAGYYASLENGLSFGPFSGDGGVGTFGGSEDHTAIVCARPGHLSQFTYVPVRRVADVPFPSAWTFVLAASGVAAEKAGRARAQYNRASLALGALTDLWRRYLGPVASLREALDAEPDAEARLRAVIDRHGGGAWPRDDLVVRLTHFAREYPRPGLAAAAFAAADAGAVAALATASHEDADLLLRNQVVETNALAAMALRGGAFAASAFGAGFGGSVWALVATSDAEAVTDFGEAWLAEYRATFPARASGATWFAARPSAPLTEVTPRR
jgi:galactokinase